MAELSDFDIEEIRQLFADADRMEAAELKLSGETDRTIHFEFRDALRPAKCRACCGYIPKGNKVIWCCGNTEAVLICLPCVKALGRIIRSIID